MQVSAIIARKQTIASMASDMERWMVDRDRLSRQLEKCQWKRDEAAKLGKVRGQGNLLLRHTIIQALYKLIYSYKLDKSYKW